MAPSPEPTEPIPNGQLNGSSTAPGPGPEDGDAASGAAEQFPPFDPSQAGRGDSASGSHGGGEAARAAEAPPAAAPQRPVVTSTTLSSAPSPAAADPDRVTSPVTSPPYWTVAAGGGGGHLSASGGARHHGRTASLESVLPPGAITLRDNEEDEEDEGGDGGGGDDGGGGGASPAGRGGPRDPNGGLLRDRNRACWAKSVEVTDYVVVNGSATNVGAFVVWNIRVETLTGSYMNIRKRYSEFDSFRRQLVATFPGFEAAVPELPPKSVISKFRPRFLEKRRAGLQYFLNCILLNPEFSGSPVLKEFLFS